MNERLRPCERIRRKRDFLTLYKNGSRFRGRFFNLVYLPNRLGHSRVAVVVSRKVGGAVTRNRIKRWFRVFFRRNKPLLAEPVDLIVVARREIRDAGREDVLAGYIAALDRIFRRRTPS